MLDKTIEVNVHPKYSLLFNCDDDEANSCDSSQLSGTWDIYSEAIYP